jgi:hypothetical protein
MWETMRGRDCPSYHLQIDYGAAYRLRAFRPS